MSNNGIIRYEERSRCRCLMNFSLSAEGLKRINFNNYENNFEFQFQDGRVLKVPDFLAEFISPVVSNMKANNPNINFLKVEETATDEMVDKIENLLHGQSVNIVDLKDPLINIFTHFKNPELIESLPLQINNDNLVDILSIKTKAEVNIDKEIEYGAIHFEKIKDKNFSLSQLKSILSCDKLKLFDEKSLLDFVIDKYRQDPENYILFKFIHCEFLEKEDTDRLISIVNTIPHEKIGELWPALNKIRGERSETEFNKRFLKSLRFAYDGVHKFKGIFNYLSTKSNLTPRNIIENGTIEAIASSEFDSVRYPLKSIVQSEKEFSTEDKPNQFVLFDFKDKKVSLTAYSLKSNSSMWSFSPPKSWKLEGSNDKCNWTILDERTYDNSISGYLKEELFEIQNMNEQFRYLKLTQTDLTWVNNYFFALNRIEFFGQLVGKQFFFFFCFVFVFVFSHDNMDGIIKQ